MNLDGEKCPDCGGRIVDLPECPNCGHIIMPDHSDLLELTPRQKRVLGLLLQEGE